MNDLFGPPIQKPLLTFREWKIREGNALYRTDFKGVSNTALLAYLLRDYRAGERLLDAFGSIDSLAEATLEEIKHVRGITAAKAEVITAAFELLSRRASSPQEKGAIVSSPEDVYRLLKPEMENQKQEVLKRLCLNTKNRVIHIAAVHRGTLNATLIHPRDVFYGAIRHCAASIVIAHNHPGGDPSPSPEDVDATKQLAKTGKLIQIPLCDHVIIGNESYFSMKAENLL